MSHTNALIFMLILASAHGIWVKIGIWRGSVVVWPPGAPLNGARCLETSEGGLAQALVPIARVSLMAKSKLPFKQTDVSRAIRGFEKGGKVVDRVLIDPCSQLSNWPVNSVHWRQDARAPP
jgi:hypothetical protein